MEIKPFSMNVNPEQSRIIQEFLFGEGYVWAGGDIIVQLTNHPYLVFGSFSKDKPVIMWSYSHNSNFPSITFEQFKNLYMNKTTLEITPDKVLSTAKKCPQAKEVLKEMFPEVFEEDKSVDLSEKTVEGGAKDFLCVRSYSNYANKAFYLNNSYNWEIKKDNDGSLCLIPTKKS